MNAIFKTCYGRSGASMVVYNCSNNSIILSGLRTRLSASFTLKSFTLRPSLIAVFFSRTLSSSRGLLSSLAVSSSFYLDPIPPQRFSPLPPLLWSIINPSIPSRSFHPHIIRACTHAGVRPRLSLPRSSYAD